MRARVIEIVPDQIINYFREAELEEMEKTWREENQRILSQYPADGHYPEPVMLPGSFPPAAPVADAPVAAEEEPVLPFEAPGAPDDDPTPPAQRPLP